MTRQGAPRGNQAFMYLHIRKASNANSVVVTLRESYREDGKVRKRQHHLGCCPLDLEPHPDDDRRHRAYGHRVGWFWMSFDAACERLDVKWKMRGNHASSSKKLAFSPNALIS